MGTVWHLALPFRKSFIESFWILGVVAGIPAILCTPEPSLFRTLVFGGGVSRWFSPRNATTAFFLTLPLMALPRRRRIRWSLIRMTRSPAPGGCCSAWRWL